MSSIPNWTKANTAITDSEARKLWQTSLIIGLLLAIGAAIGVSYIQAIERFYIIAGIIGLMLMAAMFYQPQIGAYLLIFTVFANISDLFTESGLPSINQPLVAVMFVAIISNLIFSPKRLVPLKKISRVEWALIAYVLIVIMSYSVAIDKEIAYDRILDLIKNAVILVLIFLSLNSRKKLRNAIRVLISTITLLVILGVAQNLLNLDFDFFGLAKGSIIGQVTETGAARYGGPLGLANVWGQVLVVVLPYFIYRVIGTKNNSFQELLMLGSTLLLFLGIVLTGSRGAYAALVIILPIIALELRIRVPTIFIGLAMGAIILLALPKEYTNRFTSLLTGRNELGGSLTEDDAVESRLTKMRTGLAMFADRPFIGVGIGNYSANYWDYADDLGFESAALNIQSEEMERDAHSLYIEILAETGLLGMAAFAVFVIFLIVDTYQVLVTVRGRFDDQRWKNWVAPIFVSLIAYLVSGTFLHGVVFRWFWIIAALALASIHLTESQFERT